MALKLILDTDIGTDVDDAWALSLILGSSDIELIGITLVHADLDMRARITAKMLTHAGRTDIPVYIGESSPMTAGAEKVWGGYEGADTDFSDADMSNVHQGAVDFICETLAKYPGEVVLAPVGPFTNIAKAIEQDIEAVKAAKDIVLLGSHFDGYGKERARKEHNAIVDPLATKITFESEIAKTIIGLNVTKQVSVDREYVQTLETCAYGRYLAQMTYKYFELLSRDITYMHDPLDIAAIIDPTVVETCPMHVEVLANGYAVYNEPGECKPANASVAVGVDTVKFNSLLKDRINVLINDCN